MGMDVGLIIMGMDVGLIIMGMRSGPLNKKLMEKAGSRKWVGQYGRTELGERRWRQEVRGGKMGEEKVEPRVNKHIFCR